MRNTIAIPFALALSAAAALAAGTTEETATGPDLAPIKASIESGDYAGSITALTAITKSAPSADVFNLLGYAQRKSGDLANAEVHYAKALELDPKHKGALEYQGEMFLMQNKPDMAKANLMKLTELCPSGCEELSDLQEAMKKVGLTN